MGPPLSGSNTATQLAPGAVQWMKLEGASSRFFDAVVMASEWVLNLGRLKTDLEQPINSAVQAARMPWWH